MKRLSIKTLALMVGAPLLTSCLDHLYTSPQGSLFDEEQQRRVVELIPERLEAQINGMYGILGKQFAVLGEARGRHDDFGYPMVALSADLNGPDMVSTDDGFNWFAVASSFEDRIYTYANPYMRWALFYRQIKIANDILAAIPEGTDNPQLRHYKGQALATRAFAYFSLVQLFQFTYKGSESLPAVPIITHLMEGDPSRNPRATVQEVYALILSDLNRAVELLEGFQRLNKAAIDRQVALGIRARVHLVMQSWGPAAIDAQAAMEGYPFLTHDEVAVPSFYSATAGSWMWAILINPANIPYPLVSWPSKLSSFAGNAYTTAVGTWKSISSLLWSLIPDTDVRKGWWVDQDLRSPLIDDLEWPGHPGQPIGPLRIRDAKVPFTPYTNVKFGVKGEFGNPDNASDWPLMRAEEMLLIRAEGLAMSGELGLAAQLLQEFVRGYRDPAYTVTATDPAALQNEIWKQRRIELWGEGFAFTDVMRLRRNIVRFNGRVESNFPDAFRFNLAHNDGWLLLRIPQAEIDTNLGIPPGENNSGGSLPAPGQGGGLTDGVVD